MHPALALLAETRVPRYTSYPPATRFHKGVTAETAAGWLGALDPAARLSLYLHVPFCRQVCWYCACNMQLAAREAPVRAYGERLGREIALVAERLPGRMAVGAVHWGGGTPTSLPPDLLRGLTAILRERFAIAPGAETAIEIDPRTFDQAMAPVLAGMGCTRASLGVQEFDPAVQRAVNRVQPLATVRATVDSLRTAGIGSIAFDLMYGLPHQTVGTLLATCREAVALRPDRIALFGYAHVPWIAKNQRLLPEAALPGPEERFAQAEAAGSFLAAEGYLRIGLDHFARPDDPMARAAAEGHLRRTFQGYSVDDADALIGFGATAIGRLPQGYVQNLPETRSWSAAVDAGRLPVHRGVAFTPEDRLRGRIIERLMCELAVDPVAEAQAAGLAGFAFDGEFAALGPLVRDGLCRIEGTGVTVPSAARAALRIVAAVFDATLAAAGNGAGAGPRHAVAV